MVRTTRRQTLALAASTVPLVGVTATVSGAQNATIEADPDTPDAVSTHKVTVTVDGDATGSSWNSLVVDYSETDADISDVGQDDLVTAGIDRGDDADGATVDTDATADVSSVDSSNDGKTLTVGLGGNYSLQAGDELVVTVGDVSNPGEAGNAPVGVTVNAQSAAETATATLTIGQSSDADDDDGDESGTGGGEDSEDEEREDEDEDGEQEDEEQKDEDEGDYTATVTFEKQTTDGTSVEACADLPDGGYIAIHDTSGTLVGHSEYLPAGAHKSVCVELDDTLESKTRLVAMPHRDVDGDTTFDFGPDCSVDTAYRRENNDKPVTETAMVTVTESCES
ncbi:hypothetical protein [Haloarchaeobius sp. HME9146]|uniref:DUF7282 domain-containing protein n=1 Tax=Haloarchaeobius sp. HME9146 TaxID=2978732 RepID=UPI0021C09837|nr:hypothetical protein [Haloarchaeobius sp. HME9146]MCT9095843.1 hypothetical protein [Haloarchaeobius sp. HME9146]